jgi:hypothetical protein
MQAGSLSTSRVQRKGRTERSAQSIRLLRWRDRLWVGSPGSHEPDAHYTICQGFHKLTGLSKSRLTICQRRPSPFDYRFDFTQRVARHAWEGEGILSVVEG